MKQRKETTKQEEFINPFKIKAIKFWADKWKVDLHIIQQAMGVTGCSRVETIREYLTRLNFIKNNSTRNFA
ncbi:MAG: hypothetical protein M3Q95_13920 [Bacteroidota bacterium]|nr:hypothetical protein [Bacteroidota bacterium]